MTIPVTHVERDLSKLAAERVKDALLSVTQLCDDPGQRYVVSFAAAGEMFGLLAGFYELYHRIPSGQVDPIEMAAAALSAMKDAVNTP